MKIACQGEQLISAYPKAPLEDRKRRKANMQASNFIG